MRKFVLLFLLLAAPCFGDDWPQWLGPQRDGVWRESGTLEVFPKDGPKVLWRAAVGAGYSGPAVAAGRVFVTDHVVKAGSGGGAARRKIPGVERVHCFNQADGKPLWSCEYDCDYTISYGSGPRTTPAVDGDRVYTYGAEGDLLCLNTSSGKVLWHKKVSGPDAPTPIWGCASHPLIDGNKVIVLTPGKNSVVTAFNKMTGDVLWTSLSAKEPGYAAPVIYEAGGKRQLMAWDPESLNSLDPETGSLYWSQPFGPVRNGVSILQPRKIGDLLLVSSANEGCLMMKLDEQAPRASILWKRGGKTERQTDALHMLMSNPILTDANIYGVCIGGELRCLHLRTGDRIWSTFDATSGEMGRTSWSNAFLTPNPGPEHTFIANEHGDLILANLSPKGYKEISRAHLLEATNKDPGRMVLWSHPAYANRCIFWRNEKELICASLAAN
jgi:outer membrane protein assembly factor BamB